MTPRRYAVVAGGGTGGHVFQGLALARALVARGHRAETIELVGSRRGQEATLLAGSGFPVALLPGRGIQRRLGPSQLVDNLRALLGLAVATVRSLADLAWRPPQVVATVGGYAAFGPGLAAVVLRRPLVVLNVDAVPGVVNRTLGRFATACAVAFAGTPLPRAVVTGAAVRTEVAALDRSPEAAEAARQALGLPAGSATVAAFGGSLGARRINEAVLELARGWERPSTSLYHVTGRRDWEWVEAARPAAGPLHYHQVPFEERMDLLYAAADVVICRAGAITVAELAAAGVPAVLVPLPGAPGDHQTANATALVEAGAAVHLPDAECEGERLAALLDDLLGDRRRLVAMGEAARALGHPDAAERIADLVEGAVAGRGR